MKDSWKENSFILAAFVIMAILFYSSSMPYSNQSVTPVLDKWMSGEPFKGLLSHIQFMYAGTEISIAVQGYSGFVEFFLRKGAHFFMYFLLGTSWFMGLKNKMNSLPLALIVSFLLAAGYASFDEFHQGLTPERTPLLEDIILDCMGAGTGILLSWLVSSQFSSKKKRRKYRMR